MDNKQLLVKSATLLYRESQLPDRSDNSSELVRTVIENIKLSDVAMGFNIERETLSGLKELVLEMCRNPVSHEYSNVDLLQRFRIILGNDSKLYEAIEQGLMDDLSESQLKRNITNIKRSINNHFKEQSISDVLDRAASMFRYNRDKIKDVNQFVASVIDQLEPLQVNQSSKDPAVIDEIVFGNNGAMANIFDREIKKNVKRDIFKTGWTAVNRMLQGGFRRGECVIVPALQHKYKTGFSLSLFAQLALYNKPTTRDPNKKPMLLRISFEDDLAPNIQFLYQYLRVCELKRNDFLTVAEEKAYYKEVLKTITDELPNDYMDDETRFKAEERVQEFVYTKLMANGWHIKMMRVDPTQWTYRSICNEIIELEAQGFEIEMLELDYLAMVPTTGCRTDGPVGTPIRDLYRRIRNFCSAKNIGVITPHQLSTEAKALTRTGMSDANLVKEVAEKGYFADCRQLDQEVDLEIYIHIARSNRTSYLTVQRGKHRLPTIIPDEDKYFLLKFPEGLPIPDDFPEQDQSYSKMPVSAPAGTDDVFKF